MPLNSSVPCPHRSPDSECDPTNPLSLPEWLRPVCVECAIDRFSVSPHPTVPILPLPADSAHPMSINAVARQIVPYSSTPTQWLITHAERKLQIGNSGSQYASLLDAEAKVSGINGFRGDYVLVEMEGPEWRQGCPSVFQYWVRSRLCKIPEERFVEFLLASFSEEWLQVLES
jgi:hypothetical protein